MDGRLRGLTILVPESRELDLFAGMLEAEGAHAVRCPLVRTQELESWVEADEWLDRLARASFDDLILMTGEGLRRLIARAAALRREGECLAALARLRIFVRGPKPARVLRELGLSPGLPAKAPTSQGLIETVTGLDLCGRRIAVQLYPGQDAALTDALAARGAHVFPVTPYRYASQAQSGEVAQMIVRMAAGEIGMVAFTSSSQPRRLAEVAKERGCEEVLKAALARTIVAAVGPLVEEEARKLGAGRILRPTSNFHLKPLVAAILAHRAAAEG